MTILLGNHDLWLGPFYRSALGAQVVDGETLDLEVDGLRLHVVHGHRLGARRVWKGWMESRLFLDAFALAPGPLALALEGRLDASNDRHEVESRRRHLRVFEEYRARLRGRADVVAFGHLHHATTLGDGAPLGAVLGDWKGTPHYLRIDSDGAALHAWREDQTA